MKRLLLLTALLLGSFSAGPLVSSADACPMCQFANKNGEKEGELSEANRRPRAYMYSILFMISMPATIFAGFSFSFYRMWKQQHELTRMSLDEPLDR